MNANEERLRARFAELKKRDAGRAPDFEKMRTAPRRRAPWQLVIIPAATLAAAAMFVLWCGAQTMLGSASPQAAAPRPSVNAGGGAMGGEVRVAFEPVPLDFLLDAPGTDLATRSGLDANPIKGW
jgi:hypothetical protein